MQCPIQEGRKQINSEIKCKTKQTVSDVNHSNTIHLLRAMEIDLKEYNAVEMKMTTDLELKMMKAGLLMRMQKRINHGQRKPPNCMFLDQISLKNRSSPFAFIPFGFWWIRWI